MKHLRTNYIIEEIPHNNHPNPQLMRDDWACLNGVWNLEKLNKQGESIFLSKILVPFSPETLNSGIKGNFVLNTCETLEYSKTFYMEKSKLQKRSVLHFGAVDSECTVEINGKLVGSHVGGFTPFSFDISKFLIEGENFIKVKVSDEATRNSGARGKQSDKRGGIWYTAQSGIWQTVWLEFMPTDCITNVKITPNRELKKVCVTFESSSLVKASVFDDGKQILTEEGQNFIEFDYDFVEWSPENPKLYDLILTNESGDKISSYFGMRSFEIVSDKNGKLRFGLNGKPYFMNGVLDQGYWSDGMLTSPSDKAMFDELKMLKDMGFNTVRKHIKIEPMRWYHYCDKLGLIVWQDFVNGGGDYKFTHVAAFPFLGFHHSDEDYKYFARTSERGRNEFINSIDETVNALYNVVSLGVYVPFNEGWGQFDSCKILDILKSKDNTRIIDLVSGWHDQGKTKTPVKSLHTYYTKLKVPKDPRPVVLSEFGGYSLKIDGHVYDDEKEFGYKKFKNFEELSLAVEKLYLKKLLPLIKQGLSGAIYTQVSDVEEEINGLLTYDRKVQKISTKKMREINDALKKEWQQIQ